MFRSIQEQEEIDYQIASAHDRYDGWGDPDPEPHHYGWEEIYGDLLAASCIIWGSYVDELTLAGLPEEGWFDYYYPLPF